MTDDVRAPLATYLRGQAEWRQAKADEYPGDERNQRSAGGLRDAAGYVLGLPADDERLVMLGALGWVVDERFLPGEEAARLASRYRFDVPNEAPDEWLTRFTEACIRDAQENVGADTTPWED